ncbi:MAG: R3H domain-containing nucleic acid-binding protein [bacterium]|nr:R3H domain-containing nucleic acid-binding protein [bacterium]
MKTKIQKQIQKIAEEFFKKAGFPAVLDVSLSEAQEQDEKDILGDLSDSAGWQVDLRIDSEEAQALIGKQGQTLADLQCLLKRIFKKKMGLNIFLRLDINQYRANKERYLKDMANESADRVALEKKECVLPEMSSFDRRVIHLALENRSDVTTESIGESPNRKIVIKPH